MKLSTILVVLLVFATMASAINAQALTQAKKKTQTIVPATKIQPKIRRRFSFRSIFKTRTSRCNRKISRSQAKIVKINASNKLSSKAKARIVKRLERKINRQSLIKHKNVYSGRLKRCSKSTTRVIKVKGKDCKCSSRRI